MLERHTRVGYPADGRLIAGRVAKGYGDPVYLLGRNVHGERHRISSLGNQRARNEANADPSRRFGEQITGRGRYGDGEGEG